MLLMDDEPVSERQPPPYPSGREPWETQRRAMVEEQIQKRGIASPRVLQAMLAVPRHAFVPEESRAEAYLDQPLPIGMGQTISQPFMVAAMAEALELAGTECVLEVGAGSGYQAAVVALLARDVYAVEWHEPLAILAGERLAGLGYRNVHVEIGDGTLGWPDAAPFDGILVTAAAPRIPPPLLEQLTEGGRLVIPLGTTEHQELLRITKRGDRTAQEALYGCRFVPLVGRYGWPGRSAGPNQ